MDDNRVRGEKQSASRRGGRIDLLLAAFAVIIFSLTYTLLKIALIQLPPTTVGSIRFLLCTLFVLPFVLTKNGARLVKGYSKREWLAFIAIGFVVVFVPQFLQNIGLVYTSAALAGVIQSTIPVFAGVLAFFVLREKTPAIRWLGAAISLAGVILLSGGGSLSGLLTSSTAFGNLLQVGASFSSGAGSILVKRTLATKKPDVVLFMSLSIGGLMLTAAALVLDRNSWPSSVDTTTWMVLLLVSGLYSAALFCWYRVLQHVSVARLYFTLFLLPVIGVIAPVLVLRETFPLVDVLLTAVIIVGLAVAELTG